MLKRTLIIILLIPFSSYIFAQDIEKINMTCPESPNCVSSMADTNSNHYIKPYTFNDSPDKAMARLKIALLRNKRVTLVTNEPGVLKAEVKSLIFRFIDDVEFTLVAEQEVIHVRSSSRTGYYDFGVNRRRIEKIRKLFNK